MAEFKWNLENRIAGFSERVLVKAKIIQDESAYVLTIQTPDRDMYLRGPSPRVLVEQLQKYLEA